VFTLVGLKRSRAAAASDRLAYSTDTQNTGLSRPPRRFRGPVDIAGVAGIATPHRRGRSRRPARRGLEADTEIW